MRKTLLVMLCTAGIHLTAQAGEFGTAEEAKAMLEKAVAAVEADKASALEKFTKGEDGFKDRDLYPYCGGPDGNFTAHPTLTGQSLKDLKDKAGKPWARKSTPRPKRARSAKWPTCGRGRAPIRRSRKSPS
ncbi:chemotaxis protein [Azotobacter chroococcum]